MSLYYQDDWVTLYCGDCRELRDWLNADVLVSDVPYGMGLRSGWNGAFSISRIHGDDDTSVRDKALELWGARPALVFGRWSIPRPQATRQVLTWDKGFHVGMGDLRLPWKPNTEEIYVLGGGYVGIRGSSVIQANAIAGTVGRADRGTRLHPTQKPLDLMTYLIDRCPPGIIADPFAGAGSTLVAAKYHSDGTLSVSNSKKSIAELPLNALDQDVLTFDEEPA
jgi:site-specific DNA-methyltransferase (adenine-specific)